MVREVKVGKRKSRARQKRPLPTGRGSPGLGTIPFPQAQSSGPDITVATKSDLTRGHVLTLLLTATREQKLRKFS